MSTVRPIEDSEKIQDMIDFLGKKNPRDRFLFLLQLYTGMRISEILPLKVRHVRDAHYIKIYEDKTKKEREIPLGKEIRKIIGAYIEEKQDWEYLFKSKKSNRPVSRQQAYRIYREAADSLDIKRFGCHSPRKDFGAKLYKETGDIVLVQKALNHSSASITELYIGLTKKKVEDAILEISFGGKGNKKR